ncbi:MAG: hypothetical protein LLF81_01710 [Porphyromonadaceae bacterium]|nr:hypothetical protein [Porphyromonadaceae bacterium]
MRAKELLNNQREILKFYDRVKKTIDDLSPLCTDPRKTEEYTNSHLFADAQYLATHQDDNKNVPPKIYKIFAVRTEILNILKEDDSFIYAHNIIAENRNGFTSMESLKTGEPKSVSNNTPQQIQEMIRRSKEDYPKESLDEYLLDEENAAFYHNRKRELERDNDWWLDAFNRSYALFDEMRAKLNDVWEARSVVKQLLPDDHLLKITVMEIVLCMMEHYSYQLDEERLKNMRSLSVEVNDILDVTRNENYLLRSNEAMEASMIQMKEELEAERIKRQQLEMEVGMKGMTTAEIDLVFYYLFNELGVNFNNTTKESWIRFIETLTGRHYQNIKTHLNFSFESPQTQKDLRKVYNLFLKIFPEIAQKILNDSMVDSFDD